MNWQCRAAIILSSCLLSACMAAGVRPSSETVVLKDGGPGEDVDVSQLPDAVPRMELVRAAGNKSPYEVLGKTYHVNFNTRGFTETGLASWYGTKFHGNKTSNGEVYDMYAMTAAHKTLAIPAYVRVVNLENGLSCVVRVNDRGPFHDGRIIDLSYAAAKKLGFHHKGTAKVRIEVLEPPAESQPVYAAASSGAAPVAAAPAATTASQGPFTYLQIGAFSKPETADNLRLRLASSLSNKVTVRPEPGQNLFKVLVGPILDNMELLDLRQKLADAQLPNSHLVEY
jgi:rare lipoprotein A